MSDLFVTAYLKSSGEKVRIPRQYLGHPILGKPYSATPKIARAKRENVDEPPATPAATNTKIAPSAGESDKEQS